jgi:hypothetical protein
LASSNKIKLQNAWCRKALAEHGRSFMRASFTQASRPRGATGIPKDEFNGCAADCSYLSIDTGCAANPGRA